MMNNWGAKLSNGKILVMMDSDRILPKNYFTDKISKIKHGEIVSCLNMEKLDREYSDEEIELKKYESFLDSKSEDNNMHRKNAFSGNSIIFRKDYLDLGGMDERYVGYGYADNDFTRVASVGGMRFEWDRSSVEIHLHHGCENTPNYRRENLKNGLLYCKKWNLEPEFGLKDLMSSLKKHPKKLF
jgi:GT2 family glycosyltransferase